MEQAQEARAAYVRFERRAVENVARTREEGRFVAQDVDYVMITPPYTRDVMTLKAPEWLKLIKSQASRGDIKKEWYDNYIESYEAWKRGEEIPVNGSPIKGWGVISPAQQAMLIKMSILTVEDLAGANSEGARRIGMIGPELISKAKAWLDQLKDKGPTTIKISALEKEVSLLTERVRDLSEKNKILIEQNDMLSRQVAHAANFQHMEPTGIRTMADLRAAVVDDEEGEAEDEVMKPRRGRPPKAA